jgi:hypothetical protein
VRKALCLKDAARLLGTEPNGYLTALDNATSAVFLAAAPATSGLTLSLFDPKNDIIKFLDKARVSATSRLSGLSRRPRGEVIHAAHAVVIVAAFLEELPRLPGIEDFHLTRDEQLAVAGVGAVQARTRLIDQITNANLPVPGLDVPYMELRARIRRYYLETWSRLLDFLRGLSAWDLMTGHAQKAWEDLGPDTADFALRRYEGHLVQLAATSAELLFWVNLHQVAATQNQLRTIDRTLRSVQAKISAQQREHQAGLVALGETLADGAGAAGRDRWTELGRIYESDFARPVVEGSPSSALRMPLLSDSYISPAFRVASVTDQARFSEDRWWTENIPVRSDLEGFLAAFLTMPESSGNPLLVLGHPGAGKSVLMRAIAARLSGTGFRPIRVDLRHVPADAPVLVQIEAALRDTLHRRVTWAEIADAAEDAVPVLIFDGFDELLQSAAVSRSDYLEMIQEFQRTERARGA